MSLALRQKIIDVARKMNAAKINQGTSGNVSARFQGGFLITPSGMDYDVLRTGDIVHLSMEGNFSGRRVPSTEWRFHLDIYKNREDAGAVVHCHSPYATALACLGRGIPAFHYMVAAAGGKDIRCASYATFGTQALSDAVVAALKERRACLMANHGMIAFGFDPEFAFKLAVEVETLAKQYCRCLQLGEPELLSDAEMERVISKFELNNYAKKPIPARRHLFTRTFKSPIS